MNQAAASLSCLSSVLFQATVLAPVFPVVHDPFHAAIVLPEDDADPSFPSGPGLLAFSALPVRQVRQLA